LSWETEDERAILDVLIGGIEATSEQLLPIEPNEVT
jgi:hypothetical protein